MTNLIVTTPEELKQIISDCLADRNPIISLQSEPEPSEHLHSIHALASFLGCSDVTAFKLKKSGKIRYRQFGRKLVFNTTEVLEDLNKKKR
jgi:hypothetical protein